MREHELRLLDVSRPLAVVEQTAVPLEGLAARAVVAPLRRLDAVHLCDVHLQVPALRRRRATEGTDEHRLAVQLRGRHRLPHGRNLQQRRQEQAWNAANSVCCKVFTLDEVRVFADTVNSLRVCVFPQEPVFSQVVQCTVSTSKISTTPLRFASKTCMFFCQID